MATTVRKDDGRFALELDGAQVGEAAFVDDEGRRIFYHTRVDPDLKGQGLGGRLVSEALDATRAEGLRVVPVCPYVQAFLRRHAEYADLVDRATAADRRLVAERLGA